MVGGHPRNQLTVVAPADCATPIHIECPSDCLDNCLKQCSAVQYSTVQYSTVQYSTVQYSTVQYSAVQCSTAWCITMQCGAEQQESKLQQSYSIYTGTVRTYTGTVSMYTVTVHMYTVTGHIYSSIVKHTTQQQQQVYSLVRDRCTFLYKEVCIYRISYLVLSEHQSLSLSLHVERQAAAAAITICRRRGGGFGSRHCSVLIGCCFVTVTCSFCK